MSGQIHFKSFEKLGTKERFEKEIAQATACSPKPSVPAVCTTYHASARKGAVEQGNFTPPNHVLTCSNDPFWRNIGFNRFPTISLPSKLLPSFSLCICPFTCSHLPRQLLFAQLKALRLRPTELKMEPSASVFERSLLLLWVNYNISLT